MRGYKFSVPVAAIITLALIWLLHHNYACPGDTPLQTIMKSPKQLRECKI